MNELLHISLVLNRMAYSGCSDITSLNKTEFDIQKFCSAYYELDEIQTQIKHIKMFLTVPQDKVSQYIMLTILNIKQDVGIAICLTSTVEPEK